MKKASKQTTAGAIALLVAALAHAAHAMLDNDPTTVVQWEALGGAFAVAFALWKARDHDVSSKDAGLSEGS